MGVGDEPGLGLFVTDSNNSGEAVIMSWRMYQPGLGLLVTDGNNPGGKARVTRHEPGDGSRSFVAPSRKKR